jgi:hypothetical protein
MKITVELLKAQSKELLENTFQLTLHHNEPKQDTTVVKRQLSLAEAIMEIKNSMGAYRSIELINEQTGELMYQRYASLDFYPICECLDNDLL